MLSVCIFIFIYFFSAICVSVAASGGKMCVVNFGEQRDPCLGESDHIYCKEKIMMIGSEAKKRKKNDNESFMTDDITQQNDQLHTMEIIHQ